MKASEHKYMIPQINSAYSALTPAEKKIADYVLENARKVIYLSVSELAEKTEVGDSTIIRFCRSIGLKGYQEFKLMLAQELVVPVK
ncbi:MAG: MurR/RpiR family transcriptional regulator, partial [Bacillota bacterium]